VTQNVCDVSPQLLTGLSDARRQLQLMRDAVVQAVAVGSDVVNRQMSPEILFTLKNNKKLL